ncbi:sigma-70 family RNA polymerase sigma factor [Reyranella sp.]|uniref:sigma-70 family RNA polymerase sigma factor n=1 Tax=Reyranella sp. TaxID=1929291 RepID=UPI003F729DA3
MPAPDDLSALMRAARKGDDEAYRRLLVLVAAWLRGVALRGLAAAGRPRADCEDVVQETLLAMHLKRDTWDETQPLQPWLRAIARHKLVDHLRRRGFTDHVDIDDHSDTLAAPEAAEEGSALDARQMLGRLPERQRRIVEGISIEGQSAREVGVRLGLSEGAVRVTLHRALRTLAAVYRKDRT